VIYEDRQYQLDCADAWACDIILNPKAATVVAIPTGGGKTMIMCLTIQRYLKMYPHNQVVVLSHTQDIVQQDRDSLSKFFPDRYIGLYSSGLNSKTVGQITVAGIQTAYRSPEKFVYTNLYIIDECHTVNHKKSGMYRNLLSKTPASIAGMSATVFRTGHGFIYEGDALFDTLSYDLTSVKNFNKLVDDGYLTKLVSVSTKMQLDTKGVKKSGGDYNIKALSEKHNRDSITKEAIQETLYYGKKYKKWLVFAIDIDHAESICKELVKQGINADVLHSKITKDRQQVIHDYKYGDTQALVSVGMITTGFDSPFVDLIVLLRSTESVVLHVQMIGRGLRIAPGKSHCLVLDFAGNTKRLGPINNVKIPRKKGKGTGEAPVKVCPNCRAILPASVRICDVCGLEFKFKVKISGKPGNSKIVQKDSKPKDKWLTVNKAQYQKHKKIGKPDSVLVIYHCGMSTVKDWIHPEHSGYAGRKAENWLKFRGYKGAPTVSAVLKYSKYLKVPKEILVNYNSKYPFIKKAKF